MAAGNLSCFPETPLQMQFLEILPAIQRHCKYAFRWIPCYHRRQDAIAEAVALCWKWFVRLAARDRGPTHFPTVLAGYATRAVRSGRRLCRQESTKDVLSPTAQRRKYFVVGKLPDVSCLDANPLQEALVDNTQSPVPEQVAFRIDWPSWNKTQEPERRKVIGKMLLGHGTNDLAHYFRLSPARISQLRRELERSWREFIREQPVHKRQPLLAV